ncbi:uncharacterized protein LOC131626922 isoform X2 [Vicia villosa]|uniref:uncharacterized protein LOC131626922 isoform X2 n=1 Tax=Vicia villosa TaxID=3911 RepID=UPI00273B7526|nr:uncharacterized protein LOC131626922 isoform X2 [Vicia villosa]
MALSGKVVHGELLDTVCIEKLSFQQFPEIEPCFVRKKVGDLRITWRIWNNEGTCHELVYNNSDDAPVVTSGWAELQNYYDMPADVVVILGYYENNDFEVAGHVEITSHEDFPRDYNQSLVKF